MTLHETEITAYINCQPKPGSTQTVLLTTDPSRTKHWHQTYRVTVIVHKQREV